MKLYRSTYIYFSMTYTIILLIQVGLIFTISKHVSGFDNLQQLYIVNGSFFNVANLGKVDDSGEYIHLGSKTYEA